MKPVLLAIQFLTRLPVRVGPVVDEREWGLSACAYPWVGLLIGLLLAVIHSVLSGADPGVVAILLLVLLTGLTGALHLDGLADSADAWVGGHGSRERTLEIMKDPACGPAGVSAVALVLLAKYAALSLLLQQQGWLALLVAPTLGRAALLWLLLTTPYVRAAGLGSGIARALPKPTAWWSLGLAALLVLLLGGGWGLVLLAVVGVLSWVLRGAFLRRLGGTTGDTLGAACELVEATALVTLALLASPG